MAFIVHIDDDLAMDLLGENLRWRGHRTSRIGSATDALKALDMICAADLVILDIIMSWPESQPARSLSSACSAGMEIWAEIRKRNRHLPVIVYSATRDSSIVEALSDDEHTIFMSKWDGCSIRELVQHINAMLGLVDQVPQPQPFIVHGHNDTLKLSLKNYLQNTLGFPEPVILHEQPSLGRTLIEKFEDAAAMTAIVFVLLTPDDKLTGTGDNDDSKRRARQNVIFEMGYLLGMLGRESGRVVLLHQGPLELPSDISGLVYVDISNGIEAAGEEIRREIRHVRY
jgi:predicted nucleotide-binding protein